VKEVRLHGRGGQGLVKAAHIIVKAAVDAGKYATFIPFFGVERKGSPVYGYLRLDDKPIRLKTQVYHPDCVVVLDDSLLDEIDVFEGMKPDGILVINTPHPASEARVPESVTAVGALNATDIALEHLHRNIPNTVMLGAFCRTTGWLPVENIAHCVEEEFGAANSTACHSGYERTEIHSR
jgi:2-oxoacid:acceptor oxidoreductase gamma subunit (pyruvate/2-ketoisovalerate family)